MEPQDKVLLRSKQVLRSLGIKLIPLVVGARDKKVERNHQGRNSQVENGECGQDVGE